MRGWKIVSTANPRGRFDEGIISGTPKPGVCLDMTTAAQVCGRNTYQVSQRASGAKGENIVLIEDNLQGFGPDTAYVSGTRCFMYWPNAGDELNMLLGDVGGTGDTVTMGELFGIENATGKIIKNSSFTSTPFESLEVLPALSADKLVLCRYRGDQA